MAPGGPTPSMWCGTMAARRALPLNLRSSPRIFTTIIVIELARIVWAEPFYESSHRTYALLWRQRRVWTTHVRLHPSRIDENTGDAARGQINRGASHHHVHGRFGATVGDRSARSVVGERAHPARDGYHQSASTLGEVVSERFKDAQRTHRVDVEHPSPRRVVDLAGALLRHSGNACAVDEDVDNHILERQCGVSDGVIVGHVHRNNGDHVARTWRQFFESDCMLRLAATGNDPPAFDRVLFRKFEAKATTGSCDQRRGAVAWPWQQPVLESAHGL